jgi:intermediate cleaving peptidase 55
MLAKTKGPVYIDLPNISASSLSSRRTRTSSSSSSSSSVSSIPKSLFDYFSLPSSSPTANSRPHDDIEGILNLLRKKDVRNGAREVEKLRLIKSEAEIRVMKRAADISCQAHSDVSLAFFSFPSPIFFFLTLPVLFVASYRS